MRACRIVTTALCLALTAFDAHAAKPKVAVFDFEFVDTSLEGAANGPRADEQARLTLLDVALRKTFADSGRFDLVDMAPVEQRARNSNLQACGGCDVAFAREIGAKFAVTGWVQKVSNLILNLNVLVRDVDSGQVIAGKSIDMRGNTDESWSRALDRLVNNYLLAPGQGVFR